MKRHLARYATMAALCVPFLAAQRPDNTVLKQVIIFGRHAARTPVATPSQLSSFSTLPFPAFSVSGQAVITPNGATNETILGGYFRLWLTQEGLLTGNDAADAASVYVRANNAPLIVDTAQAFVAGLLPAAPPPVNTVPAPDPLFDPIDAGVAKLDINMAIASVNGRIGGNPQLLSSAYAAEFAMARSVLFNYPVGTSPAPATPAGKIDITTIPITMTAGNSTAPVNPGGLSSFYMAIDPFMMEYADGMPPSDVGWGNLDAAGISQMFRVYDALLDLEFRTPYLAGVQSSNLASHIIRSILQAATGSAMTGTVGTPSDKIVVLTAANTNLAGLAGLFQLDWLVDGYPARCGLSRRRPGVRTAPIPEDRRIHRPRLPMSPRRWTSFATALSLTLATPPANVPVFIPGCSVDNTTFDCSLRSFLRVTQHAINARNAELNN